MNIELKGTIGVIRYNEDVELLGFDSDFNI